jgi:serine/threonine protein kinase
MVCRSSDIWSMGCILYQMVYGKTPFAELGLVQKLQAIVSNNYEISYPELDPKYKNAIDVIKLCLQRDAKARPTIEGGNGLLEHLFLHPEREAKCEEGGNTSNNLENVGLVNAMFRCFSSDNIKYDENKDRLKFFINNILKTGQKMERQQMNGSGLSATVADNIVEQLQQKLEASCTGNGDEIAAFNEDSNSDDCLQFDEQKAIQHAKSVQSRAQKMGKTESSSVHSSSSCSSRLGIGGNVSKKIANNNVARPSRKQDFIGQLKQTKLSLNKAPAIQKSKKCEPTGLQAVLEQGFASRFAKAALNSENEDRTLGNWTISDEYE